MSINVTVSGNPIKIHRGKLVTTDVQDADKRRKMRLQQVRQQSKELAAQVRNNVKKAKNKQQSDFEKNNQAKLKEWQNKKLLQLQNVYEDNVKEIGTGHVQAQVDEIEEIRRIERQKIINDEMASRRGKSAQELLQVKKNEQSLQKARPRQAKQFAREVENARAAMIVSQATRKTPKKKVTKGSFTIVEEESKIVPDQNDQEEEEEEAQIIQVPDSPECPKSPVQSTKDKSSHFERIPEEVGPVPSHVSLERENQGRIEPVASVLRSPTKRFRHDASSRVSIVTMEVPPDTRISDRIRSRHLITSMTDIAEDCATPIHANRERVRENVENKENRSENRTKNFSTSTQPGVSISFAPENSVVTCPICVQHASPFDRACACSNVRTVCVPSTQTCPASQVSQCTGGSQAHTQAPSQTHRSHNFEIPCKPTVRLAQETYAPQYSQQDAGSSREYRRVRNFDRNNRFGHHYITDTSHVHRVRDDELAYSDLEAGPSHRRHGHTRQTGEFTKVADERAKMADIRGRKAMEKENIQRDYQQLMKKLPALQKQGRIASLNPAKDKLHMSGARKKELERKRQEHMERAFEKVAPPTITIPESVDILSSCPCPSSPSRKTATKSVGTWKKSPEKSQQTKDTSTSSPDTNNLITLLQKLKNQKEELLKECKDLPQDSNFYNIIEDLDFVAKTKDQGKHKKVQTERERKQSVQEKVHKQVLILQNTSTQTSPKVTSVASSNGGSTPAVVEPPNKEPKTNESKKKDANVCSCKERDKLCEILIKIRDCPAHSNQKSDSDENMPEVIVNRKKLQDSTNLESGKSRKTNHTKSDPRSDDSLRSISPKRSRSESPKKMPSKPPSPKQNIRKVEKIKKQPTRHTQDSVQSTNDNWKQQFSLSSAKQDEITSSTSYYSPPDYSVQDARRQNVTSKAHGSLAEEKVSDIAVNNKLLVYINRMLEISKGNLDMLAGNVSSVSDVPTPGSSVINMRSNRPQRQPAATNTENHNDSTQIEKLSTLLKYFNLTPGDFRSFISIQSTSSVSRTRSNSTASCSTRCSSQLSQRSVSTQNGGVTHALSLENYTQTPPSASDPVVEQFAQWSELCQARINNLTQMIDKVRMEKKEMLSARDDMKFDSLEKSNNATSYLNLPAGSASSSPHSPSLEQKQLDQRLLHVQMDAPDGARDVKAEATSASFKQSRTDRDVQQLLELSKQHLDLDRDSVERYLKLIDVELQAQRNKSPDKNVKPKTPEKETDKAINFMPMLDIPKLPKLQQVSTASGSSTTILASGKGRKPPVTSNALRFNDVIHELSAIPEAENSRLSKSPASRKSASPQKRLVAQKSPTKSRKSHKESDSSASEKSNESVESMLKTIGLDWAITSLKIMNAANNNSSSSSSIDQRRGYQAMKNVSTSTENSPNNLQRTSTPVQVTNRSHSPKAHKFINSGESELSPVHRVERRGTRLEQSPGRDSSQNTFHTLPSQTNDDSDS